MKIIIAHCVYIWKRMTNTLNISWNGNFSQNKCDSRNNRDQHGLESIELLSLFFLVQRPRSFDLYPSIFGLNLYAEKKRTQGLFLLYLWAGVNQCSAHKLPFQLMVQEEITCFRISYSVHRIRKGFKLPYIKTSHKKGCGLTIIYVLEVTRS